MKKLGIIDVGSNSTRLVIVELLGEKAFKIVDEAKEAVRLGKDIQEDGSLNPARVDLALRTLKYFKNVCNLHGVDEMLVVATAAVRAAKDQKAFLDQVKQELDFDIRVLSGEEEAFYDYFGIINSIVFEEGLIIDIGGASVEIAYVKDKQLKEAVSLPFGAITLTESFGLQDEVKEKNLMQLRSYLLNQYRALPWLGDIKNVVLIGVGGTIRNIGKISRKAQDYSLERIHNYEMSGEEVTQITQMVSSMNLKQRKKIKGLSKARADIFAAACEAVRVLVEYCQVQKFIVSGHGVKEGLLYEYLQGEKTPVDDVLGFSINHLMKQYNVNPVITGKVWQTASQLYHMSNKALNNGLSAATQELKLLKTAVMLYRIGTEIRCYSFYKHSFYMLLSANINGLSHREIVMTAYTILYHQKENFEELPYGYRDLLSEEDIRLTQKLASILNQAVRLALV